MPIRADRTSLTAPAPAPTSSSGRARTIGPTARPGAVAPATATPALVGALGVTPAQSRALASRSRPGRLPGPLNFIITAASVPAYGVGQAILHPLDRSTWTASGIDYFRDEKKHVYPGQALRSQGALNFIPKAYGLRSTAAFGLDVALDPLSYVTFGGGAAVGAGGKSLAKGAAIKGIEDAIAAGEKVTTKQIAQATAADFLERAALPTTAKINFRVPLSRSKDIPIWQSSAVPKAARAVKSKIPAAGHDASDTLARLIGTNRGIHPLVKEVYENTRRFSSNLERMNATAAKELDDTITAIAKDAKIDVKQANKEIALHLDNPTVYPLRPELQAGADAARAFRDPLTAEDLKAGTLTDEILVGEYFPHMADSAKGARALRNWRGQRSADKLYDPAFTKERGAKDLDAFAAAGEKHGFTPEFNVARALEARGMASIKARQVRAITDTLEEFVGVKPPPRSTAKEAARLAEAKAGVAEALSRLREISAPRPTAALQAEASAARQRVTEARQALAAAQRTGSTNAVRTAQWRLQVAERKAAGQVRYAARTAAETAVPRFRELMLSAQSTGAALPKPAAGRYVRDLTIQKMSSKLRRFSNKSRREARDLRATVADDLRAEAKRRRASYKPSSTRGYGATGRSAEASSRGRHLSTGEDRNPYAFNGGNENSGVHYRAKEQGGGRKNLADYEQDYLGELADQVDRHGIASLPEKERRIYEAHAQASELDMIADEIDQAFLHSTGGAFGELDAEQGLARLQELAATLVGTTETTNLRAMRARRASSVPVEQGGAAVSERGAAAMERYFTPEGPGLADQAVQVENEATRQIQDAIKKADRRVARAKKDVTRAQKRSDQATVKQARRRLERAQAAARESRLALEQARGGAVGTPREIIAQTKDLLKAEGRFTRAENDLTAVQRLNTLLEQKPARPTTPEEWKALGDEWAYVKEGTAKNKGVKVPADIREGLDEVHKLIQPLLNDDAMRIAGRFIAGFTSRWKVLALLTPGYHVRNQIDDGIRSFMAGARNPRSFEQAARILRGGIEGASGSATIRIGKKVYTHDQYLARARAYGVIDAGFVRTEVMSSGQTEIRRTWHGLHSPGRGRAAQASSTFGNYRENVNRLGLFMELEKSGRSPLVAARRTREFLIDYGEVGAFVDNARKFIFPFITYTSKVLPLFARELARHPGFYSHYGAATGALTEAAGNPDLSQLQAWNRSSFAVPLPGALAHGIGVPNTPIINPNGLLGVGTLDMLDPTSKTRVWSTVMGSLANPLIRAPINIGTGTNAYFGSNMSRLATAPGFIKFLADAGVPIPTYVQPGGNPGGEKGKKDFMGRPVPGYSSYLNEILGILPVFNQGARVSNPDSDSRRNALVKLGLGLPISDYDAEKQRGFAAKNQGK